MFNSDFKEKDQEEIEIKDVEAEGFHDFLKLLQPFNANILKENNYRLLVAYSHRFLAREAFVLCEEFILSNFDHLDKIELLKMAFDYNWTKLKDKLVTLITPSARILCNNKSECEKRTDFYCYGCSKVGQLNNIQKKSSFLVTNKDAIAQLPSDIQVFLFKNLLEKAAKL